MKSVGVTRVVFHLLLAPWSFAFQSPIAIVNIRTTTKSTTTTTSKSRWTPALFGSRATLTSTSASTADDKILLDTKRAVLDALSGTQNGITATPSQIQFIDTQTRALELLNPTPNPARSPSVEGTWRVRYTNAPPPSNGQLIGPLRGTALQSLDLTAGIYANELRIGSSEDDPWLSVVLLADWEDVGDGIRWLVTFRTVTLTLFGRFDVLRKEFGEGTKKVWSTTFVDGDMRVMRAGVTEEEGDRKGVSADPEDYSLFVMTREPVTRRVLGDIVQVKPEKITLFDVLMDPARFMDDDD